MQRNMRTRRPGVNQAPVDRPAANAPSGRTSLMGEDVLGPAAQVEERPRREKAEGGGVIGLGERCLDWDERIPHGPERRLAALGRNKGPNLVVEDEGDVRSIVRRQLETKRKG